MNDSRATVGSDASGATNATGVTIGGGGAGGGGGGLLAAMRAKGLIGASRGGVGGGGGGGGKQAKHPHSLNHDASDSEVTDTENNDDNDTPSIGGGGNGNDSQWKKPNLRLPGTYKPSGSRESDAPQNDTRDTNYGIASNLSTPSSAGGVLPKSRGWLVLREAKTRENIRSLNFFERVGSEQRERDRRIAALLQNKRTHVPIGDKDDDEGGGDAGHVEGARASEPIGVAFGEEHAMFDPKEMYEVGVRNDVCNDALLFFFPTICVSQMSHMLRANSESWRT
jgi:hypothetical protein